MRYDVIVVSAVPVAFAELVTLATTAWPPSVSAAGVKLHAPVTASAVAVAAMATPSMVKCTTPLAMVDPDRAALLVMRSPAVPVSCVSPTDTGGCPEKLTSTQ